MEYKIINFPNHYAIWQYVDNTVYPTILLDSRNIILVDSGFIGSTPRPGKGASQARILSESINRTCSNTS